jgi:hypothetical protein
MVGSISRDIMDESLDAKARWFKSLPLEERMDVVAFTNLILENNPDVVNKKYVRPASEHIRVISLSDLIASKRASGGDVDLEDVRILTSEDVSSTRED